MKFKPAYIEATTLDDAWYQLLYNIDTFGRKYKIDAGSYAGDSRLEFDSVSGFIHKAHERPLSPKVPEGSGLPVPTDDASIEQYFANYLMDPNLEPHEEYRYATWINGQMLPYPQYCRFCKCSEFKEIDEKHRFVYHSERKKWEEHFVCQGQHILEMKNCPMNKPNTQLDWCIRHFKEKGYGNNHCHILIGDRHSSLAYEKPYTNEMERGTSPCLRGIDLKIKDGQLVMGITFRSWDLYSGFPENMGGFILLNEFIAAQLDNVEPGPLAFHSHGLHCYGFQLDVLKARLGK